MAARRRGLAGVYRIGYPGVKPSGVWIGHGQRDRANVPGHLTGYARARDMGGGGAGVEPRRGVARRVHGVAYGFYYLTQKREEVETVLTVARIGRR